MSNILPYSKVKQTRIKNVLRYRESYLQFFPYTLYIVEK